MFHPARCRRLTIFLCLGLAKLLYAQGLEGARALYYLGIDGDRAATRQSTRALEALASDKPNDPLITAYLASNKLLEAGRTLALWNKNRLATEGILGLDKAVRMAPDNPEVRFVRALSTYDLPSFFKRQQQSEEDLAWLSTRVADAAMKGQLERRLAAAALYYYGLVQEKKGVASAAAHSWKEAASLAPNTKAGMAAALKLR